MFVSLSVSFFFSCLRRKGKIKLSHGCTRCNLDFLIALFLRGRGQKTFFGVGVRKAAPFFTTPVDKMFSSGVLCPLLSHHISFPACVTYRTVSCIQYIDPEAREARECREPDKRKFLVQKSEK